jgi:hypothetical protein
LAAGRFSSDPKYPQSFPSGLLWRTSFKEHDEAQVFSSFDGHGWSHRVLQAKDRCRLRHGIERPRSGRCVVRCPAQLLIEDKIVAFG